MNFNVLRDELISALGSNLICLLHTGSHVRGEARPDSDYDFAIIVSKINKKVLNDVRSVLSKYENISAYILDSLDLKTFPKAMYLQFIYSIKLFGDLNFPKPSAEDIE